MTYAEELAAAVGYDDEIEGSVDALIAYKDALEETLDGLEPVLRDRGIELASLIGDV